MVAKVESRKPAGEARDAKPDPLVESAGKLKGDLVKLERRLWVPYDAVGIQPETDALSRVNYAAGYVLSSASPPSPTHLEIPPAGGAAGRRHPGRRQPLLRDRRRRLPQVRRRGGGAAAAGSGEGGGEAAVGGAQHRSGIAPQGATACSLGRQPQVGSPNNRQPRRGDGSLLGAVNCRRPFGACGDGEGRLSWGSRPGYMPGLLGAPHRATQTSAASSSVTSSTAGCLSSTSSSPARWRSGRRRSGSPRRRSGSPW